jgi:hypothetical protein
MSWVDIVGYAAALAVLCSFSMSAIVPLRILAIMSNVLFALYGVLADLYPVFFLHSILLPINLFKLARIRTSAGRHRLPRQVQDERDALRTPCAFEKTLGPLLPEWSPERLATRRPSCARD